VKTLDLDKKRIIVVQEVNEKYIFFGCEGGSVFSFGLEDLVRIEKKSTSNPCTARFVLEGDIILGG